MKIFDIHSHWSTERGYPLQTDEGRRLQKKTFASEARFTTEAEMAEEFRRHQVRAILDLGFTKRMPIESVRPLHDYAMQTQSDHPDVIHGHWLQIDPRLGAAGVEELRRCIETSGGFIGYCVSAAGMGIAADDPVYDPFYALSMAYRRPVLVLVGHTGAGAGRRGGDGLVLDLCHPRYVDRLAARNPDLDIIAGRPAWPWQDEMISVLLHKANVHAEMHGWSPKYFTDALKREIPRRLRERIMFGADYPLLGYERLLADWRELGYGEEVLADVCHRNAERLFGVAGEA